MKAAKILSTPASKIERDPITIPGVPRAEEKIFVTVRVRPLSKKELALKDAEAWEVDGNKLLFKMSQDRSNFPASYIFDKVFGPTCLTERVYEEGAKDVALSALTGINATIFLYGQTSSGKTYTMRGITENTLNNIYKHINNNPETEYIIKISAMEIYNEVVRDLLKPNSGPLRLLDDPEKGTIVEKLEEESAKDIQHLRHLIGICEEQRQVAETSLNDTSSRSHQIIRLTIESNELRENSGSVKSFIASLNFVDLAGSERAALTHATGARLKEGCHINRSLLTLTTVIRKLSQGKKSGHIPYRDSKLTRILQPSLGGNSRTAIICTISPALTHVEQSRNTLFFANCAKEVTNSAKVNVVVSDKQLVKHLEREVARLESELHIPESTAESHALLKEKEAKIYHMEMEMENLKKERDLEMENLRKERDLAQLQLKVLQKKAGEESGRNLFEPPSKRVAKCLTFTDCSPLISEKWHIKAEQSRNQPRQSSVVPSMFMYEIRKLGQLQIQLRNDANQALEVLQKEFACHRLDNQDAAETIAKLQAEIREINAFRTEEVDIREPANSQNGATSLKEEITRLHSQGSNLSSLEEQLENVQKLIDKLMMSLPLNSQTNPIAPRSSEPQSKKKKLLPLNVSSNVNRPSIISTPCSPISSSRNVMESEVENKVPDNEESGDILLRDGAPCSCHSSSVKMRKLQKIFQSAFGENMRSITAYVTELKERVTKLRYQKQLLVCQVLELEENDAVGCDAADIDTNASDPPKSPNTWRHLVKGKMQQVLQLWDTCRVSIIHRTQFYLLIKSDPADQIYIEVELNRLRWMHNRIAEVCNASPAPKGGKSNFSLSSSLKKMKKERAFLAKRLKSRLIKEEREYLYTQWHILIDGKKRKLQLVNKLWTDPIDPIHIDESANLVAWLVGFCEGGNVTKEMYELNLALPASKKQ